MISGGLVAVILLIVIGGMLSERFMWIYYSMVYNVGYVISHTILFVFCCFLVYAVYAH